MTLLIHLVKLSEETKELFGFCVPNANGKLEYYQYNSLPFGVATAVFITERLTRPIKAICRKNDVSLSIYIDDGIVIHKSKQCCQAAYNFSVFCLMLGGWNLQPSKCISIPVQIILYLGYYLDSIQLRISVPLSKCERVIAQIDNLKKQFYEQKLVKNKDLAKLLGKELCS